MHLAYINDLNSQRVGKVWWIQCLMHLAYINEFNSQRIGNKILKIMLPKSYNIL